MLELSTGRVFTNFVTRQYRVVHPSANIEDDD